MSDYASMIEWAQVAFYAIVIAVPVGVIALLLWMRKK